MKEIMNEISKKANEVAKVIGEKTEAFSKKTEEVIEIQKVKSQIRALEQNIEVDLCDLGEIIYAKFKEEQEIDSDLTPICVEIKERLELIDTLEKQVLEYKGQELCNECGKPVDKAASFCSCCGAKIERPVEPEEDEETVDTEPIFEEGDVVESAMTEDEEVEIELIVEEVKVEEEL